MSTISITGFTVSQNGQDFIIGKAKIQDLLKYTMYTTRLIVGYDEDEQPIYNNHIQRKVEDDRTSKIADFLIYDDSATFPTNIVLGIPAQVIDSQIRQNELIHITFKSYVAEEIQRAKNGDQNANVYITIIDGQHRIAGVEKAIKKLEKLISNSNNIHDKNRYSKKLDNLLNIELVISCFIDKTLEYQAMIFSTINRTQKKVSQDLVQSLFGLSSNDTPYKTALEITLALNSHPKSPFYRRVKLYGGDYDSSFIPPLSQSAMIKKIVSFISESLKEAEKDRYKNRSELRQQKGKKYLPFRSFYANNNDKAIADCMFYYFTAVKKTFEDLWEYDSQRKPTNVLQSTVGFDSLMDLLKDILIRENKITVFSTDIFEKYISRVKDLELSNIEKFPMSTYGKKIFYDSMFIQIFPDDVSVSDKRREIDEKRSLSNLSQN